MGGNKNFPQFTSAQRVKVAISSATTTTVITGVTGQTIRVLFYFLVSGGAGNITLNDGTTAISGDMPFAANQGAIVDHTQNPLVLGSGNSFTITTSSSATAQGYVMYTQGNA